MVKEIPHAELEYIFTKYDPGRGLDLQRIYSGRVTIKFNFTIRVIFVAPAGLKSYDKREKKKENKNGTSLNDMLGGDSSSSDSYRVYYILILSNMLSFHVT